MITESTAELRPIDDGDEGRYLYSDEDQDMIYDDDEDTSKQSGPRNDPEWQFFDTAKVYVQAGSGGIVDKSSIQFTDILVTPYRPGHIVLRKCLVAIH